jgi:hypothetical protein
MAGKGKAIAVRRRRILPQHPRAPSALGQRQCLPGVAGGQGTRGVQASDNRLEGGKIIIGVWRFTGVILLDFLFFHQGALIISARYLNPENRLRFAAKARPAPTQTAACHRSLIAAPPWHRPAEIDIYR